MAEAVLKKLAPLAAEQLGYLWGLRSEISKLERTVSSIKAVLLDAEEQSSHNHQVQHWLGQLKEVLYDVDDLLDDLATEAVRKQQMDGNCVANEVHLFFSGSNQIVYGLEMARAIKEVQSKLDEIAMVKERFKFKMHSMEQAVAVGDWRRTDSSVPDAVVGREEDKWKLIDMVRLSNYKEKVAVIPIVGIGGLGKTTLAQLLYNDDKVKSHFELKLWVCVSENFDPSFLIRKVLESATKKEVSKDLEANTVKELLHEAIKDKRFLLVLDDVWNEDREKWARFKNMLSSGAREGSKIVVTTRIQIVADIMATETIVPHELQGLSKAESWTLFEKLAFRGGATSSPNYVEIGKEIVGKCRGVPLAIRTMGGLLYFKDTEQEWESVKNKQLLGFGLDGKENAILATLRVSYNNLPSNLKRCFAYCGLFPKDHKIEVKRLVQLWMAQGYVESSQSSFLDDVGVEYFKSLLHRSFFQEATKDKWGNIEYCKMHDLMHDLAMEVSGKETIVLNICNSIDSNLERQHTDLERIRHVSIGDSTEPWNSDRRLFFPNFLVKATKLRTYMNLAGENIYWKGGVDEKIFTTMTGMRTLSPNREERKIMPHNIRKLKHLRYLDLSFNGTIVLPEEITCLVNLQVLKLYGCAVLQKLPRGFGKLSNLLYLNLQECTSLKCMPVGIGKLSSLRELSIFIVGAATDYEAARISELKDLNNLSGKLRIKRLELVKDELEAVAASLKEKKHL
ncbi:unnamed protein product [Linum tenue]|nr:unnamed protein product [Linum tenue]